MNYQQILEEIYRQAQDTAGQGAVASYIPQLADVDPHKFGMCLTTPAGEEFMIGESRERFSIQSISKVMSLAMILPILGEQLWQRIDVEPSGNPFNSIIQLEYENGIPRNPFINAGALVMADVLLDHFANPKEAFLQFVRRLAGNQTIEYDRAVATSEMAHGHVNASLAYMMKSYGNIHHEVEQVLDLYFHQCAIAMSCQELARAFMVFSNEGCLYQTNTAILTKPQVKRINALMQTCGFYDEAGEFSFRVGLPGKSGVGGGIVAVQPQGYSVAVWSPRLNRKGNSVMGMRALELFTSKTCSSIF